MIKNISKKTVLCSKCRICRSTLSKAIGLMFSGRINDYGLVFVFGNARRIDMHMLFVFFPIDVIFLDDAMKVIELKERFLPFTFYYSHEKARYVIELPAGTIRASKTLTGDIIELDKVTEDQAKNR